MTAVDNVRHLPDVEAVTVIGGVPAFVPEGTYQLAFKGYRTLPGFAGNKYSVKGHKPGKLELQFRIIEGEYHDVVVSRFFNVMIPLSAGFGRNGTYALMPRSDFLRTYCRLFGRVTRRDRVSLRKFRNVAIAGTVRHVKTDRNQKPLPEANQYAVIGELLTVEAGSA